MTGADRRRRGTIVAIAVGIALAAVIALGPRGSADPGAGSGTSEPWAAGPDAPALPSGAERATFAGGCFWCVEADFDKVPGVLSTTSGYTGGHVDHPTYRQVSAKGTGHAEAVEVVFDPRRVRYQDLLVYFWHHIDPTTLNRQFCDVGSPYRTAIFTHGPAQAAAAQASLAALQRTKPFEAPVVTQIVEAGPFWPAEAEHQDYYLKNPLRYAFYRRGCGRDGRLAQLWGTPAAESP
jgi:peptide-methionine (S)-S-oxide reductase